jgi:hypothetical protein
MVAMIDVVACSTTTTSTASSATTSNTCSSSSGSATDATKNKHNNKLICINPAKILQELQLNTQPQDQEQHEHERQRHNYSPMIQRAIDDLNAYSSSHNDHHQGNDNDNDTRPNSNSNNKRGEEAYTFLKNLASSPTFRTDYWHRAPLLLRSSASESSSASWMDKLFTLEHDILPRVSRPGGSYMAGHKTADSLRQQQPQAHGQDHEAAKPNAEASSTNDNVKAKDSDTWEFTSIKQAPADGAAASASTTGTTTAAATTTTTMTLTDVQQGLQGGTIYFNTAGGLWPHTLGALCRLTMASFGLSANVNVYLTAPQLELSVPPHTDRQDVLVFQTAGQKRWRVYAPPRPRKHGVDPLARGKQGDTFSESECELGEPLLDAVLQPGDFLYVPTGFPHTTDTCTVVAGEDEKSTSVNVNNGDATSVPVPVVVFNETSVHLTMGLDTHVWGLTLAHLRWLILQRCQKPYQIKIEDDDVYWAALEAMPMGFLLPPLTTSMITDDDNDHHDNQSHGDCWLTETKDTTTVPKERKAHIRQQVKHVMHLLEPRRWKHDRDDDPDDHTQESEHNDNHNHHEEKEDMPSNDEFDQVIEYMFTEHVKTLFDVQTSMFTPTTTTDGGSDHDDVGAREEAALMKAFEATQLQSKLMQQYGVFGRNDQLASSFAQRQAQVQEQLQQVQSQSANSKSK